jgi:tRNA threonylcarbamoyladenosine biosynthesis protein TsaB
MNASTPTVSVAIETTCRNGGVALGVDGKLRDTLDFDAAGRAATHLITSLDALLAKHNLTPTDINDVYVAVGPGSFTGTRVGVTVARTLAQTIPGLRCVAVPTAQAVILQADTDLPNAAIVLDAGDGLAHATPFARNDGAFVQSGEPQLAAAETVMASLPRPIYLIGEGLGYHDCTGLDVRLAEESLWFPTAASVWKAGAALASAGDFVEYHHLLPIYARPPKVVIADKHKKS